jgi:hypothetical protein
VTLCEVEVDAGTRYSLCGDASRVGDGVGGGCSWWCWLDDVAAGDVDELRWGGGGYQLHVSLVVSAGVIKC